MGKSIKDLGKVAYNSSIDQSSYFIDYTIPSFQFNKTNQNQTIFSNNSIIVFGGKVHIEVNFAWTYYIDNDPIKGFGKAEILSD